MAQPTNIRMAALTPDKIRSLVEKVRKTETAPDSDGPSCKRLNGQTFPLSSAQTRFWFLYNLAPDNPVCNNPIAVRLSTPEPLDFEIFTLAVNEVVRRHEILGATFSMTDAGPVQTVTPKSKAFVTYDDLSLLVIRLQERRIAEIAVYEARLQFNLESGPVLRVKLVKLGAGEYVLLVTSHHIVMDGWSNGIFSKELATIYAAFVRDRPSPLSEPRFQYSDYVNWENNALRGERLNVLLDFWRGAIGRVDQTLQLPTDHIRGQGLASAGSLITLPISRQLAERLRTFSRLHGVTLYQTLLATFFCLLYRWTGQTRLRIGTPVANRTVQKFEGIVGLFMNTIVICAETSGRPSFRDFLSRVQLACQGALAHQELPFEKLVSELEVPRDLSTHPIFQVFFVYQNFPGVYSFPGMTVRPVKFDYGTAKFDLNLWVEDFDESLLLSLNFRTDLFETKTASRLLERFQMLLEDAVAEPDKPISEIGAAWAQSTPMSSWRDDHLAETDDCLQLRFERVAAANPGIVAVECGDELLLYGDLNRRANQLARLLISRGLTAPSRIAILLERSVDLIVAILAVMKAGATYVPMDPLFPPSQLGFMVADAEADLVITERSLWTTALDLPTPVLVLEEAHEELVALPESNLHHRSNNRDLAYVIYTSGTSGRPKGVCIEHRNLLAYVDSIEPMLGLSRTARLASVSSIAADLGNTVIFASLATGRCLVLIRDDLARDGAKLRDYFRARPVDCIKIVPSHFEALLCISDPVCLVPRGLLILGGEVLTWDLVDRTRALAPTCRILNHYGPTETTIGALAYVVPYQDHSKRQGTYVPIGFPLGDTIISIRDGAGNFVPEGSEGELLIGGPAVSRGYLKRPLLNEERYVIDPAPGGDCARLFKTGDRVRRLPSGELEFLGRLDRQVKVRGHRVELPEVEMALLAHPGVRQAVCFTTSIDGPSTELRAAVVLQRPNTRSTEELLLYLRDKLPPFMLPSRLEIRDAIPLTVNGKTDFSALSGTSTMTLVSIASDPRDDLETRLLDIWREVLGSPAIGVHDDFFGAGGHSLAAMRMTAKAERLFKRPVPVTLLFERPTVTQLAAFLREGPFAINPLVSIQRGGEASPIVLVHPAGGVVLCYRDISNVLGPDVPVFGLQADPGILDSVSIKSLATKYVSAIETLERADVIIGGWSMGGTVAFEMACQLESLGCRPRCLVILDQPAPKPVSVVMRAEEADLDVAAFISKVERYLDVPIGSLTEDFALDGSEEKSASAVRALVRAGVLAQEISASEFRKFVALQREHTIAAASYSPGRYGGEICVFRAAASDAGGENMNSALGWERYATGPLRVETIPGNHYNMMRPPFVFELAARLRLLACRKPNAGPEEVSGD